MFVSDLDSALRNCEFASRRVTSIDKFQREHPRFTGKGAKSKFLSFYIVKDEIAKSQNTDRIFFTRFFRDRVLIEGGGDAIGAAGKALELKLGVLHGNT